ncbi:MAG: FCD domain-containing protein [Aquisalimonadaceae bacterium]
MGASNVDIAYDAIRRDIINGVREPGEKMRIERMREIYGIGITPLRESLQRLAADGLVVINGNRGFQVAPLVPEDFIDLNTARTAVETAALRLSIHNGGDDWEAGVVAAIYGLEKQDQLMLEGKLKDFQRWQTLNKRFHTSLVEACGSSWLLRVRNSLHDQCERYMRFSVYHERTSRNLLEEHRQIADAVLARDVETACRLVTEHFSRTGTGLIQVLNEPAELAKVHANH